MKHLLCLLILGFQPVLAQERPTFSLSQEPSEMTAKKKSSTAESTTRRTQWLMFTARWCQPCAAAKQDFEPWLRQSGWIVDETEAAHIRLIDGDQQRVLVDRHQITQYPTFVLVRDGEILFRQSGYPGRQALVTRYQQAVESTPAVVGAVSVGTLTGQRDNIAQLITVIRPLLNERGTVTLRLRRLPSQTATLPLGERLALLIDDPLTVNFTMQQDQLTCRFEEPLPRARLSVGLPIEQAVSAVTVSVTEIVLELPRAPDVRLLVEP